MAANGQLAAVALVVVGSAYVGSYLRSPVRWAKPK